MRWVCCSWQPLPSESGCIGKALPAFPVRLRLIPFSFSPLDRAQRCDHHVYLAFVRRGSVCRHFDFCDHYTEIDRTLVLCILAAAITLYSLPGGLKADIRTDLLQFLIILMAIGLFVFSYVISGESVDFAALEFE